MRSDQIRLGVHHRWCSCAALC